MIFGTVAKEEIWGRLFYVAGSGKGNLIQESTAVTAKQNKQGKYFSGVYLVKKTASFSSVWGPYTCWLCSSQALKSQCPGLKKQPNPDLKSPREGVLAQTR